MAKKGKKKRQKTLMYQNIILGKYLVGIEDFVGFIVIFVVLFLFLYSLLIVFVPETPISFLSRQWKVGMGFFGRA